jgi:hypothetical protein
VRLSMQLVTWMCADVRCLPPPRFVEPTKRPTMSPKGVTIVAQHVSAGWA